MIAPKRRAQVLINGEARVVDERLVHHRNRPDAHRRVCNVVAIQLNEAVAYRIESRDRAAELCFAGSIPA